MDRIIIPPAPRWRVYSVLPVIREEVAPITPHVLPFALHMLFFFFLLRLPVLELPSTKAKWDKLTDNIT